MLPLHHPADGLPVTYAVALGDARGGPVMGQIVTPVDIPERGGGAAHDPSGRSEVVIRRAQ